MKIIANRIIIREIHEKDKYGYWQVWNQFLGMDTLCEKFEYVTQMELASAQYERLKDKEGVEVYSIIDRYTEEYLGMIDICPTEDGIPELGIIIDEKFQNIGIGKEASVAFCNWLYSSRNMDHIDISIRESNTKSLHLYENLGAKFINNSSESVRHYVLYFPVPETTIKNRIEIIDGHDSSSYFWIMPVKIINYLNTNALNAVEEMLSAEISIEEDDVNQYLTPFLYKHFDMNLEANKNRVDACWRDDDGIEHINYVKNFEWYLTYNFYTINSILDMLSDIRRTMDALIEGKDNEFTGILREKRVFKDKWQYARKLRDKQNVIYNANQSKQDDTPTEIIIDFYHRFIRKMEHMIALGEESGYDLISFMGP